MARTSLQFEGVENLYLLSALGAAVAGAVLAYGVWQFLAKGRRVEGAAMALAGAVAGVCVTVAAVSAPLERTANKVLWFVLLASVIMLAVGVFYSAVYAYLGRRRMTVLLALRFLAILALLLILFKPALSIQPVGEEAHLVLPVLLDRSGSMDTIDQADLPSRYRQAVQALTAQADRLKGHFRVAWHHFAERVQTVEGAAELEKLTPTGAGTESTDIAKALLRCVEGYTERKLAGVILISDGLHNAEGGAPAEAAARSPVPIFAIGVGSEDETAAGRRNVRLLSVEAPLEVIRNNVTSVKARVLLTGWANIPSKVLLTEAEREADSQQVLSDAHAVELPVELKWTPGDPPADRPGADIRKLKAVVQPNPAEGIAEDNAAELHVLVVNPTLRVLYVEGTLRPEYKYLRRVLSTDPNLKFMSLVRLQENRFLAQGSIDGKQLGDLPRSEEEFGFFDVLILGDLDRTFLNSSQLERIRKFVHEGKALLMLGGRNSFGPGGYGGTPVEAALPVLCGGRAQQQETTPFVPRLTAVGGASAVFADLADFFGGPSRKPVKALPQLLGCVSVPGVRAGANVLAVHPTRGNRAGPLTVLAIHQYGKGRAAAFTADTTWKWYLRLRRMGAESPYHRFWGQLIRYLAGVEKKQKQQGAAALARLETGYVRQGEKVKLTALVKGADGQPANDATVAAELKGEDESKAVKLTLQRSAGGAGLYEGTHRPAYSGRLTFTVRATDKDGKLLGADSLPLTVAARSQETDRVARDAATLKAIADARRGRYAELAALPEIIDEIIHRKGAALPPPPAARQLGLYNFTALFLIFVALLTVEWYLRRNWQLQ